MTADIISLLLQVAGGAIASIADKSRPKTAAEKRMGDHGVNIMVAGLAFQVFSLLVFLVLWGEFEWKMYKRTVEIAVGKGVVEDKKVFGELTTEVNGTSSFGELTTSTQFRHFKIGEQTVPSPPLSILSC
jgi:Na+-transporting methylmalonyl-CoA/oxaloacetate decarboxylase gamma subunit